MGVACMDEARIKVIRERNLKKKKRNEENYQVSGEVIYSSRANAFDEIVDICDIVNFHDCSDHQAVFMTEALFFTLRYAAHTGRASPAFAVAGAFCLADVADAIRKLQLRRIDVKKGVKGQFRQLLLQQTLIHCTPPRSAGNPLRCPARFV